MRKFGLIGYPLGHSFSKTYFAGKFSRENIQDCTYDNYPIPEIEQLPGLICSDKELYGLNVTIPYKSEVFRFLDFVDSEAKEIGAVNVIKIRRSGGSVTLSGYNSDITGILDSLSPCMNTGMTNALVLGTGGSSKAVCYVLKKLGMTVTQVSRSPKKGIADYSELDDETLGKTDLIVNTTPLGMYPHTDTRPDINYSRLNENHILFDLVYNPEVTFFLRSGLERGCRIITGTKMLHSQAERSWEIWNDENL